MAASGRTGVLTFHRCINYGSYWQARCLVEGLCARGVEAVLLDHDSPRVNRAEWRCAFQPLLPVRVPRADFALTAAKVRRFFAAIAQLPLSSRFALERPETAGSYDLVVIGSDEVWNLRHPWYREYPIFYGDGLRAERLVSYAASFGNHDADHGLDDRRAAWLRGFAALSVRDENSRRLVRSAVGREPELVLDPCLQFPPALERREDWPPYVAVYGHSFPSWFGRAVRTWARSRGLRLLSIGYRNDWAEEQRIDAGPAEFGRLMAGAAAVATNFFHGCVFALLNDKPFVCVSSAYRSNKLRDLLHLVGARERLVTEAHEAGDYAMLLDGPLEPAIADRLTSLRRQSDQYLDHVLA